MPNTYSIDLVPGPILNLLCILSHRILTTRVEQLTEEEGFEAHLFEAITSALIHDISLL